MKELSNREHCPVMEWIIEINSEFKDIQVENNLLL
jgi:hypothetical protein